MGRDVDMLSDDDIPLASQSSVPAVKPMNGHVAPPTRNGNRNGYLYGDESPMSEDDDLPLSQTTRSKSEADTIAGDSRARKRNHSVASLSSDDDAPLASSPPKLRRSAAVPMPRATMTTTVSASLTNGKGKLTAATWDSESDSDDTPLGSYLASSSRRGTTPISPAKRRVKKEESEEEFGDSERDPATPKKAPAKKRRKMKEESDQEEVPKKRAPKRAKKEEPGSDAGVPQPKKRGKAKKEEGGQDGKKSKTKKEKEKEREEEEERFRWWEQAQNEMLGDGSQKWTTLEHNGVIFPPPYEPLPEYVKMKYNGKPVNLLPPAEEVAGFYAAMLETDHAKDATFNKNFFSDWLTVLKKHPPRDGTKITDFNRCDFRPMFEYFDSEKAKKKALSTAEKKELKKQKDEAEAKYTACTLDGRKEKVGNFRIEPPGLFRGRGEHPKKGALKLRVRPEDVIINIGANAPIPTPNVGGNWKQIIHDNTVTWLATWIENINGSHKYVFLAAGSSLKGQSDMTKFEKARELKNHIHRIRQDYERDLNDKLMQTRMRATAMYFIDKLALRAGNEKGDDEADTVGCCSLRCEHVTLDPPLALVFDFLGKDSIRYYNRVDVTPQVFKNVRIFKRDKKDDDLLFDRINPGLLNKHFQQYMKGLSAKVFRTYNASITFQQQLDDGTPAKGSTQEKLNHYNHSNRMVAILCNHQRAVPKTHDQSMAKMKDKLRGFKYERMKLRHSLFAIDPSYKKKKLYAEDESDLDEDGIAEHETALKAKEIERIEKKFAKENEKLVEEGKVVQHESVLEGRLAAVEEEFARLEKERGTGKSASKKEKPVEKLEEAINKLDDKMKTFKLQMDDREAGKEVALGTSKINYLDPRITAAWCKKHDVPIEKLFSKTLLTKFPWALEVNEDWQF